MININNFDWPQWVMLGLYAIRVIIHIVNHGKPVSGEYNAYFALIFVALNIWILTQGGFFK